MMEPTSQVTYDTGRVSTCLSKNESYLFTYLTDSKQNCGCCFQFPSISEGSIFPKYLSVVFFSDWISVFQIIFPLFPNNYPFFQNIYPFFQIMYPFSQIPYPFLDYLSVFQIYTFPDPFPRFFIRFLQIIYPFFQIIYPFY